MSCLPVYQHKHFIPTVIRSGGHGHCVVIELTTKSSFVILLFLENLFFFMFSSACAPFTPPSPLTFNLPLMN